MLGENIKTYRQKKQFTQEELAERLHVTRQTISKWEKNYSIPDAEILIRLSEILEVETNQLLGTEYNNHLENPTKQDDENALAIQLANIAEQMAVKNRRTKRIWKILGLVLAILILLTIMFSVLFTYHKSTGYIQVYEESMDYNN
jgi:putative transcriptional regulator